MPNHLRRLGGLLTFLCASFTFLGESHPGSAAEITEIDCPAGPNSGQPNLSVGPDGKVFLSWIEPSQAGQHALRFSVRAADGWSAPSTIVTGENWFVNWADFPSLIALPDGSLAAHWLVRSSERVSYHYDVRIAFSRDGGATWSAPVTPHRDGVKAEHGFVSLLPWRKNELMAIWLDGREMTSTHSNDGSHKMSGRMAVRQTLIRNDGQPGPESLLDESVCECCQTSAALTAEGVIVAYRDRSDEEVRDISIVRLTPDGWSGPQTIHRDGWQIYGCPINGPSVAADGKRVAIAWFSAAQTPLVQIVFSDDAGKSFGAPTKVNGGKALGRVDVVLLDDGSAVVSWLETGSEGTQIRGRRVHPDGSGGASWLVAQSSAARGTGFPQMVKSGNEIVFAWTDGGQAKVRTAIAKLR